MTHLEGPAPALSATRRWAAAERCGDTTTLRTLLADDLVGIGPYGLVLTKEQWLARYSGGDLRNESFDVDEVTMRTYGTAVIVSGVQAQRATHRGNLADGRFRLTLVLVAQHAAWAVAHIQLASMPGE